MTGKVLSQSPGFIFSHLNTKEGLSDNVVTCFLKDSQGRLWIGTINGLNRYDGAHFYVFKKSADNHSLFNGNITALCEDKAGNIWGSTEA
ncbi:MAG TPA: two-component regulator propeller domain-containing protein, partial [Chitinophagaceae bacterium]|nr:two-component regulator propeller domain-containing protein [Chitinophagaceae bacterium]